jgi:hypothetical protein
MNKKMVAIILILLVSTVTLSGCVDREPIETKQKFDNGNIIVKFIDEDGYGKDSLLIDILTPGNYTILLICSVNGGQLVSETLQFHICNVPYQFRVEKDLIYDYDLKIIEKEYNVKE